MCVWLSVFRRKELCENPILGCRDIKQNPSLIFLRHPVYLNTQISLKGHFVFKTNRRITMYQLCWFSKRKRLNGGTVPPFKMHPGGTVPPFKMHPGGTVPPFKMHPGGTLSFYDISFLSLILDCIAKINDHLLHPFCNLSLLICSSFFISFVWKPLCLKCILEGQTLLFKCPCQLGHPLSIL